MKRWVVAGLLCCVVSANSVSAQDASADDAETCPGANRVLVFTGGGIRGAYQVGALWYLVNVLNCTFDHFVGTSTGAITAAVLAQANSQADLRQRVDQMVTEYLGMVDDSEVLGRPALGEIRTFLPHWLGGLNGAMTLNPLEERLSRQIPLSHERVDNLTIDVVSLQTGKISPGTYQPTSLVELVIGSASIPVAIQPKATRLWGRTRPIRLDGKILTVAPIDRLAVRDANCQLKFAESIVLRCLELDASTVGVARNTEVRLSIPGATPAELKKLETIIASQPASGSKGGLASSHCTDESLLVRVTSRHQLVDGGVTDNNPLRDALDLPETICKKLDTFIVLHTGKPATPLETDQEQIGGAKIAKLALGYEWDSFQDKSFGVEVANAELLNAACDIREAFSVPGLRNQLNRELAVRLTMFTRTFALPPFVDCKHRPAIITVEPQLKLFDETFEVNPGKIRRALKEGCDAAASTARLLPALEIPQGILRGGILRAEDKRCDRFLESG